MVAAVVIGEKTLRPRVGPFHRTPELARGVHRADVFREDRALHAERAADVARDEAQLAGLDVHHLGGGGARTQHALRRRMEGEASVLISGDAGARLHGVDDDAVVDEMQARDMRRARERRLDLRAVAILIVEHDVAGGFVISCGAPGFAPSANSTTQSSTSMSSVTASAAARASSALDATTQATGSPTKRTLSVASAGRSGLRIGEPSAFFSGRRLVCGLYARDRTDRVDRDHARHGARRLGVDPAQHAVYVKGCAPSRGRAGPRARCHPV